MNESRKYLVIARVGAKSLHREWLRGTGPRLWDLQLSQYDDHPGFENDGDLPLSKDKGTKWDSINRLFEADPELLNRYRYFMLMDDDVRLNCDEMNRFLEIVDSRNLSVAQPALHPDSYFCYPILLGCAGLQLRYSNFVEGMAPALRSDHLRNVLGWMKTFHSGWGIDRLWSVYMKEPGFQAAIVDEVQMLHTRPHGTGAVYENFQKKSVDPRADMAALLSSVDNAPDRMLVYGAITRSGRSLNGTATRLWNGMNLIANVWRYRSRKYVLRAGAGMLVRSVTEAGYRPAPVMKTSDAGA